MKTKLALFLSVFFVAVGCHSAKESGYDFESIDRTAVGLQSVFYDNPDSVFNYLKNKQMACSDSVYYYFWQMQRAKFHYYSYQDSITLAYCRDGEDYCLRNPEKDGVNDLLAGYYNLIGICNQSVNNRDTALVYFKKAYEVLNRSLYRRDMSIICINASDVCRQQGKYPEAVRWLQRALSAADSLKIDSQKHTICCGLGQVYADLRNFPMSDKYFAMADTLYPPTQPFDIYHFYNSRGNAYYFAEKYSEALECFKKAYTQIKIFNNKSFNVIVEGNLGETFLLLGQMDSAKFYIDRSYDFYANTPSSDDAIRFYITGLKAAYALETDNFKAASYYLSIPFDSKRVGAVYLQNYNKRLRDYYEARGDYKRAYQFEKAVVEYDDSLRNVLQHNNTIEIESRYSRDTTLLRQNVALAQNATRISKLTTGIILSVSIFILCLTAIIIAQVQLRRRKQKETSKQLATISKLRLENAQKNLSPHFIFNVLNTILPSLRKEESIPLNLLIKILRNGMIKTGKMGITLEEELEMTKDYSQLRCSISAQAPQMEWKISPKVPLNSFIPTMTIYSNVENALKYAFPEDFDVPSEGKRISVSVYPSGSDRYVAEIRDNGVGYLSGKKFLPENHINGTGSGIKILSQTFALLNTVNSKKIEFTMKEENGTIVTITIPYEYNIDIHS